MTYFFESAEAQQLLCAVAASWLGTPFRAHSRAKGATGGVFCAGLAEGILAECGAVEPCSFPHDQSDYQPHKAESLILQYLRGEVPNETSAYLKSRFAELPVSDVGHPMSDLLHGDLLLGSFHGFFHMPIVTDPATGKFIHAVVPRVAEGLLSDSTYAGKTIAHFRCLK